MTYKRTIHTVIWLICIIGIYIYLSHKPELLYRLIKTPLSVSASLVLLIFFSWITVFSQSYFSIALLCRPPPVTDFFSVYITGILANFSPIKFGVGIRAAYLKKYAQLKYSEFVALLIYRTVSLILVASTVLSLALWARDIWQLIFIIFCIAFAAFFSFHVYKRIPKLNSLLAIPSTKFTVSTLIPLLLLQLSIVGLRMFICFNYAGIDFSYRDLFILAPVVTLLSIASITPGGIGIREVVTASLATLYGIPFDEVIFAMVLDSACMLFSAVFFGSISLINLRRKLI